MSEPTLYLFDGFNLLHAGGFRDTRELRDRLASFVAMHGARGIVVFDGSAPDERYGPLEVRYAREADQLLERLAVEHRDTERVCVVSSDAAVRGTAGREVATLTSGTFVRDLAPLPPARSDRSPLGDRLDAETRERLERLRRGT